MTTNNSTPKSPQDPAWLTLGELILPLSEKPDEAIHKWLPEILLPLQLSEDFLGRVIRSAQESLERAMQTQEEHSAGQISLCFFIPLTLTASESTWGYFSIAKLTNQDNKQESSSPAIHFYLYVEGE